MRSVDSEETRPRGFSSEIVSRGDADAVSVAEGSIRQRPLTRGRAGIAGVPSPGHVSKGIVQESKRAPHLLPHQEEHLLHREVRAPKGRPEGARRDGEQSYNLIVPVEGGEPQGFPQGSGHGIHWREGGSKRTNLLKGDITRS